MSDQQEDSLIEWANKQPEWVRHGLRLLGKHGSVDATPEDGKKHFEDRVE